MIVCSVFIETATITFTTYLMPLKRMAGPFACSRSRWYEHATAGKLTPEHDKKIFRDKLLTLGPSVLRLAMSRLHKLQRVSRDSALTCASRHHSRFLRLVISYATEHDSSVLVIPECIRHLLQMGTIIEIIGRKICDVIV